MEYAADQWHSRIITGDSAAAAERWLADVETRPRLPGGASGKPLMWVHLAECSEPIPKKISAIRSVGVLADILRALDRSLTAEDLDRLRAIFDKHGQPFPGTVDFA
jgi:hypothetical protein